MLDRGCFLFDLMFPFLLGRKTKKGKNTVRKGERREGVGWWRISKSDRKLKRRKKKRIK